MTRVGLDVRILASSEYMTGVPGYVFHLAKNLMAMQPDRTVFFSDKEVGSMPSTVVRRWHQALPWQQSALPVAAMKARVSVFHGPGYSLPSWGKFKKIVTIHDMTFVKHPEWMDNSVHEYLRRMVPLSLKVADAIVVPTDQIVEDLAMYYPHTTTKLVRAIPMGSVYTDVVCENWESTRVHDWPYVLHVGTLEPRKNLETLVKAFTVAVDRRRLPHRLVLVGNQGWKCAGLMELIRESPVRDRIVLAGYADNQDLEQWYRGADLYVQAAHYEGFGISTLDAYCFGLPIIATRTGWVRDLHHDSVGYVNNSEDVDEMADVLETALASNGVQKSVSGRDRQRWSWENTTLQHQALYSEVGIA